MGLRILGEESCDLCGQRIEEMENAIEFEDFLDEDHPLFQFSNGLFHKPCFDSWGHKNEFLKAYKSYQDRIEKEQDAMGDQFTDSSSLLLEKLKKISDQNTEQ